VQTLYHYLMDPQFGWMYASIQTWFPFAMHICIHGREWLARQMDQAGLHYVRQDHCFPWIEDYLPSLPVRSLPTSSAVPAGTGSNTASTAIR
jgi:hypothetical protein